MAYFPPKIPKKRFAGNECAGCYFHFIMGMELRGSCLLHKVALEEGNKQPVRFEQQNPLMIMKSYALLISNCP